MSQQNSQEKLQPHTQKTLTLKKEGLAKLKKESLAKLKKEALDKLTKEDLAKAREKFKEMKNWLEATYPKAFDFQNPIPLKKGIRKELMAKDSPFSGVQLHKVLKAYARSNLYLKAVVKCQWRHDLDGEQTEEILEEEKKYSKQLLLLREKKKYAKKKQIKSKNEGVRKNKKMVEKKNKKMVEKKNKKMVEKKNKKILPIVSEPQSLKN
jgi:ProP effector